MDIEANFVAHCLGKFSLFHYDEARLSNFPSADNFLILMNTYASTPLSKNEKTKHFYVSSYTRKLLYVPLHVFPIIMSKNVCNYGTTFTELYKKIFRHELISFPLIMD